MSHSLDGFTPSSIERPEALDQLSKTLAVITSAGHSATPWGGGTRIGIGNIPTSYDTAIDLSGFTGKIEHEPGDMTVVANAGVTISTLNALLAKEGQRLAFEVRNPDRATVGGSVASNAPGHRQSSTGGIRDWVIGMQIVLADGTVTKSGGRVVKNVQGYELHRLHTGAYGTLGVVSQAAFKLLPLPPEQQTVIAWFDDQEVAQEVGMSFVNGLFMPEAISLLSGPLASQTLEAADESVPTSDIWALLIRLGGGVRSIERQVNEVVGTAGAAGANGYAVLNDVVANSAWRRLDKAESAADLSIRMTSRPLVTLEASDTIRTEVLNAYQSDISTICDLGFGAMTLLTSTSSEEESALISNTIIKEIIKRPASYVIEKCPLNVKQAGDVFSDVGNSIELMRRIKNQYDPANTLNPGRFAGKI
ncbi:MAG: FAD-binding oxidoreductase [Chloroflexi bacterium]|nr:FAD-binding oxidoreductase [Chloroflexota bacterium]